MLRLKSLIILIITIFSFITPFAMPFANATNVAHAQSYSYVYADQHILNERNFIVINAINPYAVVLTNTTLYFYNITSSGQITGNFLHENLPSALHVDAITYAGKGIFYIAGVSGYNVVYGSGLGTNIYYAIMQVYEFNITSKAFTTIYNSAPTTDNGIINFNSKTYPIAVWVGMYGNTPVSVFAQEIKAYCDAFDIIVGSSYYGELVQNSVSSDGYPTYMPYTVLVNGLNTGTFYIISYLWFTHEANPEWVVSYFNGSAISVSETYPLSSNYPLYLYTEQYGNEWLSFGMAEPVFYFVPVGSQSNYLVPTTAVSSTEYATIPVVYTVQNTNDIDIFNIQMGLNTNYYAQGSPVAVFDTPNQALVTNVYYVFNGLLAIYSTIWTSNYGYYMMFNMSNSKYAYEDLTLPQSQNIWYIGGSPIYEAINPSSKIYILGASSGSSSTVISVTSNTTSTLSNSTGITPTPASNSSATAINIYYINTSLRFMLPLIFILLPAIILMVYLGTKGFVGGLSLGMVIGVYAGFIPIWALVFLGIVMLFLIFWRNERGDVST